jgi:hypothetical protein
VNGKDPSTRTARCGCGNLRAELRGEPADLYLCSCQVCQQRSGSTFSYAAVYPEASVSVTGEHRGWRRNGESGRWIENHFCPTCGIAVFFYSEGMPGLMGIPVGALGDPDIPKPKRVYWASRRHRWLELPADIEQIETQ